MEITGLNAEETYKAEKQLQQEEIYAYWSSDMYPTPTLDDYARRNGLDAK